MSITDEKKVPTYDNITQKYNGKREHINENPATLKFCAMLNGNRHCCTGFVLHESTSDLMRGNVEVRRLPILSPLGPILRNRHVQAVVEGLHLWRFFLLKVEVSHLYT